MEVMKPTLVWVGDRCYRKNPCRNDYGIQRNNIMDQDVEEMSMTGAVGGRSVNVHGTTPYVEADLYDSCEPDAPDALLDELEFNIEKLESGGFKSKCENIPSCLYSVIIGMKGVTKKRIESETNTKIIVPRMNESGHIFVRGQRYQDVATARRRIDLITSQARFRREATHFVSFPLNFPHIVEKIREFKNHILTEWNGVGAIEEAIFNEPEKIHLTICVMMLLDQKERQMATDILENLKPNISEIIAGSKLEFQLQGLEIMNDDPTQVNVLYAKCNWNNSTAQKLADFICAKFADSGLSKLNRSGTHVKFHATLMNTRYRQTTEGDDIKQPRQGNLVRGKLNSKDYFDARNIFKKFSNFDFGGGQIQEIHLSTRHTSGPDGFYKCLSKIVL